VLSVAGAHPSRCLVWLVLTPVAVFECVSRLSCFPSTPLSHPPIPPYPPPLPPTLSLVTHHTLLSTLLQSSTPHLSLLPPSYLMPWMRSLHDLELLHVLPRTKVHHTWRQRGGTVSLHEAAGLRLCGYKAAFAGSHNASFAGSAHNAFQCRSVAVPHCLSASVPNLCPRCAGCRANPRCTHSQ
jgi:hypothetical protein